MISRGYTLIACASLFLIVSQSLFADQFQSPLGLTFVKINAGSFIMGTQDFDLLAKEVDAQRLEKLKKESPAHKVTFRKPFYLATTEVTQAIWSELMIDRPGKPQRWEREDWADLPVSRVSWHEVQEFIKVANQMDDNFRYRLPTEAEWEYAARAGTTGLRPFKFEEMALYAWYRDNSEDQPMPVGRLKPNDWGLYDMIGNVWEWVADYYDADYYRVSPEFDPEGGEFSMRRSMRGGSYHCTTERVRVGIRGSLDEERSLSVLGFRLVAEKRQNP